MKLNRRAEKWRPWVGLFYQKPPERSAEEQAASALQSKQANAKPRKALRTLNRAVRHMNDLTPAQELNFVIKHFRKEATI